MTTTKTPPGRAPLDRALLDRALREGVLPDGALPDGALPDGALLAGGAPGRPALWREIQVVGATGSTNADLLAAARSGAGEGLVLVAEAQMAGRGRLGRTWVSVPGASLTFSVLLRPAGVPPSLLGWVPLLAGVAAVSALRRAAAVDVCLKWPNDLLGRGGKAAGGGKAGGGKVAGILAESRDGAVVAGLGINVSQRASELPVATATSLYLLGADVVAGTRERVLTAVLADLAHWYGRWQHQASPGDADACGLREQYLRCCDTLGRPVTVTLPGGQRVTGTAAGVDRTGRLQLSTPAGLVSLSAGDVVHLR